MAVENKIRGRKFNYDVQECIKVVSRSLSDTFKHSNNKSFYENIMTMFDITHSGDLEAKVRNKLEIKCQSSNTKKTANITEINKSDNVSIKRKEIKCFDLALDSIPPKNFKTDFHQSNSQPYLKYGSDMRTSSDNSQRNCHSQPTTSKSSNLSSTSAIFNTKDVFDFYRSDVDSNNYPVNINEIKLKHVNDAYPMINETIRPFSSSSQIIEQKVPQMEGYCENGVFYENNKSEVSCTKEPDVQFDDLFREMEESWSDMD